MFSKGLHMFYDGDATDRWGRCDERNGDDGADVGAPETVSAPQGKGEVFPLWFLLAVVVENESLSGDWSYLLGETILDGEIWHINTISLIAGDVWFYKNLKSIFFKCPRAPTFQKVDKNCEGPMRLCHVARKSCGTHMIPLTAPFFVPSLSRKFCICCFFFVILPLREGSCNHQH